MLPPALLCLLFCLAGFRAARALGYLWVALFGAGGAGLTALWFLSVWSSRRPKPLFLRGRRPLRDYRAASGLLGRAKPGPETVLWGGEVLPSACATTHFLAVGTTGAGKTLLLNRLMASVLPTLGRLRPDGCPFDRRALIYDAKGDVLSTLHDLASCRVVTLHPFEARGAAWDLARDITTPAAALQAAALLIPPERGGAGNPFFTLAAQSLLRGVLLSFLQTVGSDWTFRDVVLALRFETRLRQVLEKIVEGRAILDQFFQTGDTLQGVRATLATHLAPYEVIAAAWACASEKVSLSEWMAGEFVLVLGNDEATRTALDAINRVLFQRLSELVLAGEESQSRQTWIFLDEVREAGRLEGLSRLMTKGRSKGACVVLGFQAIEGMREVYGPNVAAEIVGLCNNKAILRLESPLSAQWASELFAKTELIERRRSRSSSRSEKGVIPVFGRSRSWSEQRVTTDAVMASEIMTLPPTGPAVGLHGFFITRSRGAYRAAIPWKQLNLSSRSAPPKSDFIARPHSSQYLREWTAEDLERLGLKALRLVAEAESRRCDRLASDHLASDILDCDEKAWKSAVDSPLKRGNKRTLRQVRER